MAKIADIGDKIEEAVVEGFGMLSDKIIEKIIAKTGESASDAKK